VRAPARTTVLDPDIVRYRKPFLENRAAGLGLARPALRITAERLTILAEWGRAPQFGALLPRRNRT